MAKFAGTGSSEEAKKIYSESLGSNYGNFTLGRNTTRILHEDPKLLLFTLSRYKFVSKMMAGFEDVLEIGCQEGWGLPLVAKNVGRVVALDFYSPYIDECNLRFRENSPMENVRFEARDVLDKPMDTRFSGIFALDVLEHIPPDDEHKFFQNILGSLREDGMVVLGMPSLESQEHASEASRLGHVNCKSGEEFGHLARKYFRNVMTFCMNDEVVHTGFFPMAQYLFVVCTGPRAAATS